MGNFEKLSVLVIGVIIVMILMVAIYTWTGKQEEPIPAAATTASYESEPIAPPPPEPVPDILPPVVPVPAPSPVPEPPAPAPAPESSPFKTYRAKAGDTYGSIAKEFLGSATKWEEIQKANPTVEPMAIREGMELKIPVEGAAAPTEDPSVAVTPTPAPSSEPAVSGAKPGSSYKVRRGETLETISKKVYGTKTRWPEIWVANLNKLEDPNDIFEGMTLDLPR